MCLAIITGVMINITYIGKRHVTAVAIRINTEVATQTFVEIKPQCSPTKYKDFLNNDYSQKFLVIDPGYNSDYIGK